MIWVVAASEVKSNMMDDGSWVMVGLQLDCWMSWRVYVEAVKRVARTFLM
jgi:hypothetical protein